VVWLLVVRLFGSLEEWGPLLLARLPQQRIVELVHGIGLSAWSISPPSHAWVSMHWTGLRCARYPFRPAQSSSQRLAWSPSVVSRVKWRQQAAELRAFPRASNRSGTDEPRGGGTARHLEEDGQQREGQQVCVGHPPTESSTVVDRSAECATVIHRPARDRKTNETNERPAL
jgi:hypothetical protein